jgi:O-acetylserine/cysteine efflux transporter
MSVVVPVPMLALSLVFEGPQQIGAALAGSFSAAAAPAWVGLAYTCVIGTAVGSGIWTWLLARHPAGVVAPFSMLVPVVGIATAALVLGEVPGWLELVGGAVVVLGVMVGARRPRGNAVPVPVPRPSAGVEDAGVEDAGEDELSSTVVGVRP